MAPDGPKLIVEPLESLSFEPLTIRAEGLRPGLRATLGVQMTDDNGVTWSSSAQFAAGEDGMVDPSTQAPVAGDYDYADQAGLFWSLRPVSEKKPSGAFGKSLASHEMTAWLEVDRERVATQAFKRLRLARGVDRVEVREEGVTGTLFLPADEDERPALVVLSGSEGGTFEPAAAQYAAQGLVTFALAYFGMEGLPEELEEIPVETVERALTWLAAQPRVNGDAIGVWGASKGAELALLAASIFPAIKAVVAKSASAYVFESIGEDMGKVHKSSWTHRGGPVPFIPLEFNMRIGASYFWSRFSKKPWATRPMYDYAIKHAPDLESASIKVENINGPVLVTGGGKDGVWPSDEMAVAIGKRLSSQDRKFKDVVLTYPDAGHQIASPYTATSINYLTIPGGFVELLGGTPKGNAMASEDSFPKINEFLSRALEP
jgi:dienelactone hydrolase